jgi:pre-mRNA-splicing factor CWC26
MIGKKIDVKLELLKRQSEERIQDELIAKQVEWGKGMKQKKDKEEIRAELEKEKSKPFAR